VALKVGMAAGKLFSNGSYRHRVVIGKDTRLSGYMIESALEADELVTEVWFPRSSGRAVVLEESRPPRRLRAGRGGSGWGADGALRSRSNPGPGGSRRSRQGA